MVLKVEGNVRTCDASYDNVSRARGIMLDDVGCVFSSSSVKSFFFFAAKAHNTKKPLEIVGNVLLAWK
jgi:hypothetical protein